MITVLIQTVFFRSIYAKTRRQEINGAYDYILADISSDYTKLQESCEFAASYYNVCLLVTDRNMNTLAFAEGPSDCELIHLSPNSLRILFETASNKGGNYTKENDYQRFGPPDGERPQRLPENDKKEKAILKVSILTTDSGETRVVFVNAVITPYKNMTDSLKTQLIIMSLVMILSSFVLSFLYSRQLSKPIIEMNNEADKLALGNFDVHFEQSSGSRELDELGEKLNHAASELSKVDSLRNELIANVSHDLRTPLTLITGYSEMMRDLPGENTAENLNIIIDESKRLSQIVNDVLDISKYQSGDLTLNKDEFCLTDEIEAIRDRISAFTSSNGYKISFIHDGDVFVFADKSAISRVMYNLISNAINYTGTIDKSIEIVQTTADSEVRIDVIDHGNGIDQDELPYVFDRYYRSKEQHVRSVIGTGLGLSIVKTILSAHEARFGVSSSPGKGSDFWFSLPLK